MWRFRRRGGGGSGIDGLKGRGMTAETRWKGSFCITISLSTDGVQRESSGRNAVISRKFVVASDSEKKIHTSHYIIASRPA